MRTYNLIVENRNTAVMTYFDGMAKALEAFEVAYAARELCGVFHIRLIEVESGEWVQSWDV